MNFQFLCLVLWYSCLGLMISIASSPCTHKHPLSGACTRMETCTIQKPSCSLSGCLPRGRQGRQAQKASPRHAHLRTTALPLWVAATYTKEHTGVLLFLPVCPFLCPLSVGQPIPTHAYYNICFQLHWNFGHTGTPFKNDFTWPVGKSWGPGCQGLEKLEKKKNPRKIKLLKLPKQYGPFLLQLAAHQN